MFVRQTKMLVPNKSRICIEGAPLSARDKSYTSTKNSFAASRLGLFHPDNS